MSSPLTNRIRVLRAEKRISQSELADAIDVSRKTISTMKIARYFERPVEDVFALRDDGE
jgi:putative transcriptional regulator